MITLDKILKNLTYGEFRTLSLVTTDFDNENPRIVKEKYPEVISHLNLALTALHSRFDLISKTTKIVILKDIEDYNLQAIALKSVKDVNGKEYVQTSNVSQPKYNQIRLSNFPEGTKLTIVSRVDHEQIKSDAEPELAQIKIPDHLLEPLLYYMASRVCISGGDNQQNDAYKYLSRYEQKCQEFEGKNSFGDSEFIETTIFEKRGLP